MRREDCFDFRSSRNWLIRFAELGASPHSEGTYKDGFRQSAVVTPRLEGHRVKPKQLPGNEAPLVGGKSFPGGKFFSSTPQAKTRLRARTEAEPTPTSASRENVRPTSGLIVLGDVGSRVGVISGSFLLRPCRATWWALRVSAQTGRFCTRRRDWEIARGQAYRGTIVSVPMLCHVATIASCIRAGPGAPQISG